MKLSKKDKALIAQAIRVLASYFKREPLYATDPDAVKQYCQLTLGAYEHEVFAVLLLDSQNRLIKLVELFRGSIDSASVYPREVVKLVIQKNAAAVIFTHNHPSGIAEPSRADYHITKRLTEALRTIDVRVLDHIVVSGEEATSFSERGLL